VHVPVSRCAIADHPGVRHKQLAGRRENVHESRGIKPIRNAGGTSAVAVRATPGRSSAFRPAPNNRALVRPSAHVCVERGDSDRLPHLFTPSAVRLAGAVSSKPASQAGAQVIFIAWLARESELDGQEGVRLRHGVLRPVQAVQDELAEVGNRRSRDGQMVLALVIDE